MPVTRPCLKPQAHNIYITTFYLLFVVLGHMNDYNPIAQVTGGNTLKIKNKKNPRVRGKTTKDGSTPPSSPSQQ